MNRKRAEAALHAVAIKEGISIHEVRSQIQRAIDIGMSNPDPLIQGFWKRVPRRGEYPSPEEVICFLSENTSAPPDLSGGI